MELAFHGLLGWTALRCAFAADRIVDVATVAERRLREYFHALANVATSRWLYEFFYALMSVGIQLEGNIARKEVSSVADRQSGVENEARMSAKDVFGPFRTEAGHGRYRIRICDLNDVNVAL